jgi:hypothetical protein
MIAQYTLTPILISHSNTKTLICHYIQTIQSSALNLDSHVILNLDNQSNHILIISQWVTIEPVSKK